MYSQSLSVCSASICFCNFSAAFLFDSFFFFSLISFFKAFLSSTSFLISGFKGSFSLSLLALATSMVPRIAYSSSRASFSSSAKFSLIICSSFDNSSTLGSFFSAEGSTSFLGSLLASFLSASTTGAGASSFLGSDLGSSSFFGAGSASFLSASLGFSSATALGDFSPSLGFCSSFWAGASGFFSSSFLGLILSGDNFSSGTGRGSSAFFSGMSDLLGSFLISGLEADFSIVGAFFSSLF
mmetsp:Transcript_5983/g.5301  ORF Transcript_5983/g.5301 Transcript_5983/m.5301 type:complete len:240 (+) Transcript_5983:1043-1762(+)